MWAEAVAVAAMTRALVVAIATVTTMVYIHNLALCITYLAILILVTIDHGLSVYRAYLKHWSSGVFVYEQILKSSV